LAGLFKGQLLLLANEQGKPMPKDLTWDDAEDIGILLSEKHPEIEPLNVRFTDLHRYVSELPEFKDDPKKSSEGKLEAIQMAWHEEYIDRAQS
jgi:FeS assembly protein IscX